MLRRIELKLSLSNLQVIKYKVTVKKFNLNSLYVFTFHSSKCADNLNIGFVLASYGSQKMHCSTILKLPNIKIVNSLQQWFIHSTPKMK